MEKILITGSSGFVGKNLFTYLDKKNSCIHKVSRTELENIQYIESPNAFIHLAGKAHDLKNASNPQEYYDVNFGLTKKVYDAFLQSDAKKFIFISSVKASADTVENVLTEEDIPAPQTHYGKSKLMAEQYIQSQELPAGKSYYILRPCMIHGPGNKGNLNLLYKFVQKGIPYPLAAFDNKRSFLSIDNLCFIIDALLKKDIPSGIYNVADDEVLATSEVVKLIGQSLRQKARLWKISKSLIKSVAGLGSVLHLPLNAERLQKMTESYVVSNQKIKNALEMSVLPLKAQDGLLHTFKSFAGTK